MNAVYLAVANYDYEGYDVMAAFASKEAAEAHCEACRAHLEKQPRYPGMNAGDAEIEAHMKADDAWLEAAPPGYKRGDSYTAFDVPMIS